MSKPSRMFLFTIGLPSITGLFFYVVLPVGGALLVAFDASLEGSVHSLTGYVVPALWIAAIAGLAIDVVYFAVAAYRAIRTDIARYKAKRAAKADEKYRQGMRVFRAAAEQSKD